MRGLALAFTACAAAAAPAPVFNASAGGLGLTVFDDDSYAVWTLSAAAPWLRSAYTAGARVGGQLYTYPGLPGAVAATRLGAGAAAGSHPRLGPWRGWQINITTPRGGPIVNTFQLFEAPAPAPGAEWRGASPLIVFEQSFPLGLQGTNNSSPGNAPNGFAKSSGTSTAFPALMDGNSSISLLTDWLTWADTFFSAASGIRQPVAAGLASVRGSEGGPLALTSYAQDDTIVLAPFTNLKSTFLGQSSVPDPASLGPVAACGVSNFVAALPPGHSAACAIGYAPGGFNAGMHAWGATMMAAYDTARVEDPSSTQLTYWTGTFAALAWRASNRCTAFSPTARTPPNPLPCPLSQIMVPTMSKFIGHNLSLLCKSVVSHSLSSIRLLSRQFLCVRARHQQQGPSRGHPRRAGRDLQKRHLQRPPDPRKNVHA